MSLASYEEFELRKRVVDNLEQRNRLARELIDSYGTKHALMDVGVGIVGLVPGLGIPAILASIGAQVPVIYQPLARELGYVYLAEGGALSSLPSVMSYAPYALGEFGLDLAADVAGEFGAEFIKEIAGELISAAGAGAASTFIPFVGAFIAAGLDYAIAKKMTNAVGRMVSIHYQCGRLRQFDRRRNYDLARRSDASPPDIRKAIPSVNDALIQTVYLDIKNMRELDVADSAIRANLRKRSVPDDIIDAALSKK
jgi:hypothetical protein